MIWTILDLHYVSSSCLPPVLAGPDQTAPSTPHLRSWFCLWRGTRAPRVTIYNKLGDGNIITNTEGAVSRNMGCVLGGSRLR